MSEPNGLQDALGDRRSKRVRLRVAHEMQDGDDGRLPLFPGTPDIIDAAMSANPDGHPFPAQAGANNPAASWSNQQALVRVGMHSYKYVMENGIFDADRFLEPTPNLSMIPEHFPQSPPEVERGVRKDGLPENARKDRAGPGASSPTLVELLDLVLANDATRVELIGHSLREMESGSSHSFYQHVARLAGFSPGRADGITGEESSIPRLGRDGTRAGNAAAAGSAVIAPFTDVLVGDVSEEEELLPDPRPREGGGPEYDPTQPLTPDVNTFLLQDITTEILEDFHSGVDYLRSVRSSRAPPGAAPAAGAGEATLATFACGICLADVGVGSQANVSACRDRFCRDCMISYLSITVLSSRVFPIRCPDGDCGAHFDPWACADFLDACRARGAEQLRLLAVHRSIANLKYCANPRCNAPFDFVPPDRPACTDVLCPLCKRATCVPCGTLHHPGRSCEQARRNEPLYKLKADQKWMHCPACNQLIERVEGCEHMVCHCGAEFCYLCGKQSDDHECDCTTDEDFEE